MLVAALLAVGAVAPWVDAAGFSGPIQRAVEDALGRQIRFSKVHLTFFSGLGFSLDDVIIAEDPRYGLEPFAWVPTLQARLRIDKLLQGQFRLSSLRLEDPSLNLVKRGDGTWNVVELVQRLSAPRRSPLNLFPAFQVSDGRIDFKFGARKTTFYLLNADLSIYPERSGQVYFQFSGSPARTDRAGNGFGHLRGTANWHMNPPGPKSNQLEADVTLDPSNLSELTTLFEGEDIGVHGSIGGRAHVEGPLEALRVSGDLQLGDVHRWDLLPSSGENWRIGYAGGINWAAHRLNVHTVPAHENQATPVTLELNVNNFLTHAGWSLLARLDHAPVERLLPLCRRMGLSLPEDLKVAGAVHGTVVYSNGVGLGGRISISNATATMPNVPPLHAQMVSATILPERIHFDPAVIDTPEGNLSASGDYYLTTPRSFAALSATGFSVDALKSTINAWFGTPAVLSMLNGGRIEGSFNYSHQQQPALPVWSGQFQFTDSTLRPEGMSLPLEKAAGQVLFDATNLQVTHFASTLGGQEVHASYRYLANARRPERVRIEITAGDLAEFEKVLEPTLTAQDLLARWHVTKRRIPAWLASRNIEGDIAVSAFSIHGAALGPMSSHFVWQGANLQLSPVQINLPEGLIRGHGRVSLASYTPRCSFTARVSGFPWRNGVLSADGTFETSGTGTDSLQNLHAGGTFTGSDLNLSTDDAFRKISGQFEFSFAEGWPDLKLSRIQASDGPDAWDGNAASQSDGKLIIDLEHAGHQRRVVSTLIPEPAATVSTLVPVRGVPH